MMLPDLLSIVGIFCVYMYIFIYIDQAVSLEREKKLRCVCMCVCVRGLLRFEINLCHYGMKIKISKLS